MTGRDREPAKDCGESLGELLLGRGPQNNEPADSTIYRSSDALQNAHR